MSLASCVICGTEIESATDPSGETILSGDLWKAEFRIRMFLIYVAESLDASRAFSIN